MAAKKETNRWEPNTFGSRTARQAKAREFFEEANLIASALDALYEEFDKLSKKSPRERLTELALENVNAAIVDAKSLLVGDRYADRVKEFIAAGETPPYSDVVLVLGTLRSAVARFAGTWDRDWTEESLYWRHAT